MRVLFTVVLITMSLGLYGCAAKGKDAPPPGRTWTRTVEGTVDGGREAAWNAVLKALDGYSLVQKDAATGMAVTGWKANIVPHDMMGPQGAIAIPSGRTDRSYEVARTPARVLAINFEVKRRFTVSLTEGTGGKTRVTVSRQMYVMYFDGPKGSLNPDVYEQLRGVFDTGEEVDTVLRTILDSAPGSGK